MLTRLFTITLLAVAVTISGPSWSYDTAMAESYGKLFALVKGAGAGKALHLMKPDVFVNKIKVKEPLVTLDVRTPAEIGVFTSILPGSLVIPMNELFTEANLARIPSDKTVVVLCKSGARATAAGTPFVISGSRMSMFSKEGSRPWLLIWGRRKRTRRLNRGQSRNKKTGRSPPSARSAGSS